MNWKNQTNEYNVCYFIYIYIVYFFLFLPVHLIVILNTLYIQNVTFYTCICLTSATFSTSPFVCVGDL